jgi:ribosomal protein S18 acetylase RimI-like enzyme
MRREEISFQIFKAGTSDFKALSEVQSKSMNVAYPSVIPEGRFNPEVVAPEKLEREISSLYEELGISGAILKAQVSDRIVGICVYGDDAHVEQADIRYIQRIFVDPDFWRIGIGEALLETALRSLRESGFRRASLHILESNLLAKQFYEKRGWQFDSVYQVMPYGAQLRYTKSL